MPGGQLFQATTRLCGERKDILDWADTEALTRRIIIASRSFSNAANAGDCLGIGSRAVTSFDARPLGMTTIIGTAFRSAIRLSRITSGDPPRAHSFSSPPMPWRRYRTGYVLSLA